MKLININSETKKKSKAHYSPALVHNGNIYVSGKLPMDPKKEAPVAGGIKEQTRPIFHSLTKVLEIA